MRWDNLRLDVRQRDDRVTMPLFDQGAVVRTFDTPEFQGMTFYEVRAKSIINRVPKASYVPFRWSINPYRGCQHQCVFCLDLDTPVLLADGHTKRIADLQVGDEVYGTERQGVYRRYVKTEVLARWSTIKPAYRIALEDGTKLTASPDHRFLSNRGWKYVTGSESGPEQRPHLTLNNRLVGTGRFVDSPDTETDEYRRGYLCGMIRGDGHVGRFSYSRPGRTRDLHYRFRLALKDLEALHRTRAYLLQLDIPTQEFAFSAAVGEHAAITAIRTSQRAHIAAVEELVSWPKRPSPDWSKGFLAGIFDAEGSYSTGGILRISNTDLEIIAHTSSALDRLGFEYRVEVTKNPNGLCTVRLLGGLREAIRFFHTTDPAITRKRSIEGRSLKHRGSRIVNIQALGVELPMVDIMTGTGDFIANGVVSHNCFARKTHTYLDLDYGEDFDTKVVVKVNAPELLRKELSASRWSGEHIAMGTNVDTYQRAEGRYKLMRGILEALRDFANPFSILTKGTLILRDLDLLQQCAQVADVGTNFSVGCIDKVYWRAIEPGTPSPERRLDAVRKLNEAGIPCGVLMAPIIPFISDTDEMLERTVRAIADAGATHITPIVLHLRKGGAREWWMSWVNENRPELIPRYLELYGEKAYAPKDLQKEIGAKVHALARRFGIVRNSPPSSARRIAKPPPEPEQLQLA